MIDAVLFGVFGLAWLAFGGFTGFLRIFWE
jgi:hypothetical protein